MRIAVLSTFARFSPKTFLNNLKILLNLRSDVVISLLKKVLLFGIDVACLKLKDYELAGVDNQRGTEKVPNISD